MASVKTEFDASTMLKLMSAEDQLFVIERGPFVAKSGMVRKLMDDLKDVFDPATTTIPLKNVDAKTLVIVIRYVKHMETIPSTDDEQKKAKTDFIAKECPQLSTIYEVIQAANYLDMADLLDLGCLTIANMIKGKTVEEMRTIFGIKNDFTKEEEEVRRDNQWAFE